MSTSKGIVKWTGIVTVLLIISKITGLLRETAIAYRFGTTVAADAYLMAALLPQILFLAFSDAVKTAFIPIYSQYHEKKDGNAFAFTAYVISGGIILLLSGLLVFFAPVLVRLVAPGFTGRAYTLTVTMSRILLPGLFFFGLAGLAGGILHTKKNFIVPALTAYPSNLIIIIFTVFFGAGYGITGVAWATLAGFASQFLIQLPALLKHGIFSQRKLLWRHPGIRKMAVLIPPVILSGAATELKNIVDRIFGSLLPEGGIAALNYANRVFLLPNGVVVTALLTVIFPLLVELFLKEEMTGFKKLLRQGMAMIILLVLPMMTGLVILREPIIRLLFERGAFGAQATKITAESLAFYSLGLLFMGGQMLLTRVFFALRDTVTPMLVTFATVAVNAFFNWLLIKPMQHSGIALGTSLALACNLAALWVLLRKRIGPLGGRRLLVTFCKAALASMAMGIVLFYGRTFLTVSGLLLLACRFLAVAAAGTAVFLLAARLLRIEELGQILSLVRSKEKLF